MCKRTDDRRKSQENKLIVGYCVHTIPQKTDCNIRLIYVCLQGRAPQIALHCSPAGYLNVSLFAHVHYLSPLHSCAVCIFSLFIGNHLYIYSICIGKDDSRFILFYFALYICIHVAQWSSLARHLVPLYVHRCSGMTIKIGRMAVYVKIVTYTWLGDTLTWYFGDVSYTIVCYLTFLCRFHIKFNSLLPI